MRAHNSKQSCLLSLSTENVTLQQQLLQYMQSLEQRILEQNETLQKMARYFSIQRFANGTFQNPAPSCKYIEQDSPSGYYWIQRSTAGYASQVYCDMTRRCNSAGGWMRIFDLDMTNPSHRCPQGFRTITSPKRMCGKSRDGPGCVSVFFNTYRVRYQKVCGRVIGYQHFNTDAFRTYYVHRSRTIDDQYLDGVSLTHGSSPRKHIWSFAAANDETSSREWVCPCTRTDSQFQGVVPPFVGQDYFCETGSRYFRQNRTYTHDPLWDGRGCGAISTCCSFNSPPWFCKQLPQLTTDDIELRLCNDQGTEDEDVLIEIIELYVQ